MSGLRPELSVMCRMAPALSRQDTVSVLTVACKQFEVSVFFHLSVDDCEMQQRLTQLILREND